MGGNGLDGACFIARLLAETPALLAPLRALASLGLPDAWLGAGFVRNAVWEVLHGRPAGLMPGADIDLLYFAPGEGEEREAAIEAAMRADLPGLPVSARNQARMHRRNGDAPYADTADAMRFWPETATAVAARLTPWGAEMLTREGGVALTPQGARVLARQGIELLAPVGVADLMAMVLRPTPAAAASPAKREAFRQRAAGKGWLETWPRLRLIDPGVG